MKKKLYSVVFPVWLLLISNPIIWIMVLAVNFLVNTLVLTICGSIFKLKNKLSVFKKSILKMFCYGIVADLVGAIILLTAFRINPDGVFDNIMTNPFSSWISIAYIIICILISAFLIYLFNYNFTFKHLSIKAKTKKKMAIFIAVFTAPYLFFYPANKIYNIDNINNTTSTNDTKVQINNTYLGNTMVTRIFAESKNYTNANFEYDYKINKVSSEIKSQDKSLVTTQISANFEDSDITQYIKWAKQCSVIVLVKDNDINTVNVNLADENDENKIISNLVYERKNIEEEYDVKLEELQNNQQKLQEVLDKIKQGD